MNKLRISPFVKWAGGKTQNLDKLIGHVPATYNRYYEPFIGGGALLLDLQPHNAVINDTNEQLLNIYQQLKIDPEAIISMINRFDSVQCDKDRYTEMRDKYNDKITAHALDAECAALMIWLNKHCFNGLYRVNAKGLFNVPYNNKVSGSSIDEDNLRNVGSYLNSNNVEIRNEDFEDACRDIQAGDFVYFDSPFVPASKTANFTDYTKEGFTYDDHCRLAKLFKHLDSIGAKVMLSNNNVGFIHKLYAGFKFEYFEVKRTINCKGDRRTGKEVIITNY